VNRSSYDATLTLGERNGVFRWLESASFNPADFRWEVVQHQEAGRYAPQVVDASQLIHKATDYFFTFGPLSVTFSPGERIRTETYEHMQSWQTKHSLFMTWLTRLRVEVDAPDLWAMAATERELVEAGQSAELDNKPFSRDEKKAISTKLDELKKILLESQNVDRQRAELVEQQLRYLKEASNRVGRKDWIILVLGTLIPLGMNVLTDDQKRTQLLKTASDAFRWIWASSHLLQN